MRGSSVGRPSFEHLAVLHRCFIHAGHRVMDQAQPSHKKGICPYLHYLLAGAVHSSLALVGFRGGRLGSCYQSCNGGSEQGFAASASVVHELEKAKAIRQLVLRDALVRSQPGT